MRDAREVALEAILAAKVRLSMAAEWHAQEATAVIEKRDREAKLEVLAELERRAGELEASHSEAYSWSAAHDELRSELEKAATPSGEASKT